LSFSVPRAAEPLRGEAYRQAAVAYQAIAANDLASAEQAARAAISAAPDHPEPLRLLVDVLVRRGNDAEARAVIDRAVARDLADADLYASRAYLRLRQSDPAGAVEDFDAALARTTGQPERDRALRLGKADAALGAKQPAVALDALAPFGDERSYAVAARRGFALFDLQRYADAVAAFQIAVPAATIPTERRTALKGEAQSEAARGNLAALPPLIAQLNAGQTECDMDVAYLMIRAGDDAQALATFEGPCRGEMRAATELDAAYAARRLLLNPAAIEHFSRALTASRLAGAQRFDPQTEFGVRREVETLSREWGVLSTFALRDARPARDGGQVLQPIVEAYWQPPVIGYRDGRVFQLFARFSNNALDRSTMSSPARSAQAAFGARYKPLPDYNLVGSMERLVALGSTALDDWLARLAYSDGFGIDVEPVREQFWTGQYYAEAAYLAEAARFIGTLEGRLGLASRIIRTSLNLIGSIFINGAFSHDDAELRPTALGFGPGLSVRYWFRESELSAPASFAQFDVIYRFPAGESGRAGGLVVQLTLSY
jgi:tetratricopeptide (TPR) repeat protein